MIYTSKGFALVLSLLISLSATGLFAVFGKANPVALINIFIITALVTFVAVYFLTNLLIFRELERLKNLIRKLPKDELIEPVVEKNGAENPLKSIREQIHAFAELKQKEIEQLKKLEAFRKDFIADVSHELKTPIFAAQGFVHTLLDGAVDEKAVRKKFLKKAAKSLDGLDMLVQDLLTLSHIETGQIKMRFEEIDMYALTEEVLEQFRGKSERKEVSLRIEGSVRKVMVYADYQRITQVMTNLISNAIKHSDEDDEVVVSFVVKKKSVVTKVTDSGEGIPEEHIHRIFERFYRVDKSRSREKGGTGLGLAIVKHILDGHRSKPEVQSIPGKGSTFSFRLPRPKVDEVADIVAEEASKG